MAARSNWSREEHILAFNLYCQIPFGALHARNPRVEQLARLIGRTANSVALKLTNFARLDPSLQQRGIHGMSHGAKGESDIWHEFAEAPDILAMETQRLLAARLNKPIEEVAGIETDDLPPQGIERETLVRVRINQSFFRRRVLAVYNFRCCITGLDEPSLLNASHIVPWAADTTNRLNPRNGLCLNALHDRAFDRHLMWIDTDMSVRFNARLLKKTGSSDGVIHWMTSYHGKKLILPGQFTPDPVLVKRHAAEAIAKEHSRHSEQVI